MTLQSGLGLGLGVGLGGNTIALPGQPGGLPFVNDFALEFDGVDEYFQVPDESIPNVGRNNRPFTWSFWTNTVGERNSRWFNKGSVFNQPGFRISIQNNQAFQWKITPSQGTTLSMGNTSITGGWNHLAWVFDGVRTTRLIQNGVQVHQNSNSTFNGQIENDDPLWIGRDGNNTFKSCRMDELAYYDKALTQAEAAEIYNGGLVKNLADLSSFGSCLHWWRMGDDGPPNMVPDIVGGADATLFNMDASNRIPGAPA